MARKKDFTQGGGLPSPITVLPAVDPRREIGWALTLPLPHGIERVYSYQTQVGLGYDEILSLCVQSLRQLIKAKKPEPLTIKSTIESGLKNWLLFCQEQASSGKEITAVSIDKKFMEEFIGWLLMRVKPNGDKWSRNTARTTYSKMKVVLEDLSIRQLIPPAEKLFPVNPFPRATAIENRRGYIRPLSDGERETLIKVLAPEVAEIFDGTHPGSFRVQLCLSVFAILLKAGVNPTPLLELPRDLSKGFMDHPRMNRKILVTTKRRASKDITTPLENTESRVVSLDTYRICERFVEKTAHLVAKAGPGIAQRLWLMETPEGEVRGISVEDLSQVSQAFTSRHNLRRDDGSPLKMTSQLFRNTKLNRIWRASKGDLLATAHSGGNTPAVAERYLAVTPDMLEEHRLAGEVLVETLLDAAAGGTPAKTPVAGCRDPYDGDLAPKNGKACVDFLSCFRCKSQVITGDDLYRLFSFYWAVLGERDRIGSKAWKKVFAWILRIIDRDIAPKFDAEFVEREKERARQIPHPMWRVPEVTLAIGSVL